MKRILYTAFSFIVAFIVTTVITEPHKIYAQDCILPNINDCYYNPVTCIAQQADCPSGQLCVYNSFYNTEGSTVAMFTCTEPAGPKADGEVCTNDEECASGSCNFIVNAGGGRCGPEDEGSDGIVTSYQGPEITVEGLISLIYKILLPVSIGFGLYNIIRAGYTLKTSEGNPQRKQQGVEDLTAAIVGTLFVGLSLTLLQIIIRTVLGGNI